MSSGAFRLWPVNSVMLFFKLLLWEEKEQYQAPEFIQSEREVLRCNNVAVRHVSFGGGSGLR